MQKPSQSHRDYVEIWKLRAKYLDQVQELDLRAKSLESRLKSISAFNGIFEASVARSVGDHGSSGFVDYQKYTSQMSLFKKN